MIRINVFRVVLGALILACIHGMGPAASAISEDPLSSGQDGSRFASPYTFTPKDNLQFTFKDVRLAGKNDSNRLIRGATRAPHEDNISSKTKTVRLPGDNSTDLLSLDPLELVKVVNIAPLYKAPRLKNEGVWTCAVSPMDAKGRPIIYRTSYRPSVEFPNAIAHMMVMDMRSLTMKYYVGSQEPGAKVAFSSVEPKEKDRLIAITNAMWMQRHSRGAGAIFRGKQIYPMVNGMATLIIYKDGSVDIREWSSDIPARLVQDARQLRHLIVKEGMVVKRVLKDGKMEDSEIGLGFLLAHGGRNVDGKHKWFVAHRSAFGIRPDGALVFAVGHHVGSKDLAKALVLAGCERGMHGDANPHNIVGNIYLRDSNGRFVKKVKLSPEQTKYSLKRYDDGYTKDFFGFFLKPQTCLKTRLSNNRK